MRNAAGAAMLVTIPNRQTFLLQQRTLLDMQFDKGGIVAIRQAHLVERTLEAGRRAQLGQRAAFRIFQARVRGAIEAAAQHPATQAPQAEARWLLGGEEQELDRSLRRKATLLQSADRLQSAQHTDRAVIFAGVGNGVDVRAGADGSKLAAGAQSSGQTYCPPRLRAPSTRHRGIET